MSVDYYIKNLKPYVPLTKAEEKELFLKAKDGDKLAYETIINSNLRFVISIAKKYQNQGLELEDLIAEGNVGLLKAYTKFDISKNFKFITYAVWWIRQCIINAIHEHSRIIRLPLNKITNIMKINKAKDALEQELSNNINYAELAYYIDDPDVLEDLKYQYQYFNLDQSVDDESNQNLNNVIPDTTLIHEHDFYFLKEELDYVLKSFTPREQEIIYMYFGIDHPRAYTLKEIGSKMSLTRERIRQIKESVLEKLRKKKKSKRLLN